MDEEVKRKVLVFGVGKTATVLANYLQASSIEIAAFTAEKQHVSSDTFLGKPLLDFDNITELYAPEKYCILIAVGYHDMNNQRQRIFNQCKTKGYSFYTYVHESVTYFDASQVGEGSVILDHVTLQPDAIVGKNSFIWSNTVIAHNAQVKSHCWIASGSVVAGDAIVGENSFLGVNSTVGHSVELGSKAFLGANTLVSKNTEQNAAVISAEGQKIRLTSQQFMAFAKL